jgi:phage gp45-like
MAVVLPVGGKTAHGIVIATEHATYRLKGLESGEVALYTDEGDSIILKRGRLIEVTTETLKINATNHVEMNSPRVQLNTPLVKTTGRIEADEDIVDRLAHPDTSTVRGMRELYDIHTHHENDAHGETNPPTQQTT